jgi:lipopolysaccharide/colanic/teichoic acid biosynthesis glycosyltransferase
MIALILLIPIVLPLVALLAILIKLDTPGPVLVQVERVGRGGRRFKLLKLRSMVSDAEARRVAVAHLNTLPWPDFKIENDPRITRTGKWMRRYSLDELPQLWNIARGQMTFMGPRPCSISVSDYQLWQTERLEAVPGLMGRWQASARARADFANRCRMDIGQARTQSFVESVRLIGATLRAVVGSRGAF